MTADIARPRYAGRYGVASAGLRQFTLASVLLLSKTIDVAAFPIVDNDIQVPTGTELAAPELQDLQHQLQMVNGLGTPAGGGWRFVPRVDWQEALTDNALELNSPRQADLISYFSPGFNLAGDLPRVQMTFDFAPTLALYARTSSLNTLTEQMNGLGNVTLFPDLAFVDVRIIAGVHSLSGGLGGLGSVGAPVGLAATPQSLIPPLAGNSLGLSRNNEVQTTSFGISPYLLQHFGEWGSARLGDSFSVTASNALSGFLTSPIPSGGANGQTLVSNEENAHFVTGDVLPFLQNTFDVDLLQSQTTTDSGGVTFAANTSANSNGFTSNRIVVADQVTYSLTRTLNLFASGGHEDIHYSNQAGTPAAPSIDDMTWSLGATWTPNPDSSLTMSYGHLNGVNALTVNGHYQATARSLLTVSYGSTLGTQLETVQNQLNLASVNATGTTVNALTGGPLFGATNALAVEDGVFRTTTLAVGSATSLVRDIITINFLISKQKSSGAANLASQQSKTANVTWLHQMQPDMIVSAAFSYAIQDQTAVLISAVNPGNSTSLVASLAWQWQLSDTVSASVRYSFFDRRSPVATNQFYENMLIAGISKRF